MTDDRMALRELLQKGSDPSFLREMIGFATQRLMELDADGAWATQRARYMTLETISAVSDTATVSMPAVAS